MTIEKALEIANEKAYSDYRINAGIERKAVVKKWEKDDKKRAYISINCYTLNGKFKGSYKCGYIDLVTEAYIFTQYDEIDLSK